MILALHVIILAYIDYKRINMISNDIVNARARKNNLARAPQKRPKIAHFELFFERSNGFFSFFSLSVSHTGARAKKIGQKVHGNIRCFRRVKIGLIEKILESFEVLVENGKL